MGCILLAQNTYLAVTNLTLLQTFQKELLWRKWNNFKAEEKEMEVFEISFVVFTSPTVSFIENWLKISNFWLRERKRDPLLIFFDCLRYLNLLQTKLWSFWYWSTEPTCLNCSPFLFRKCPMSKSLSGIERRKIS